MTQDDININNEDFVVTKDDTAVEENVTPFAEDFNEDYNKTVNQQHYLLNPRTAKAEQVAKLV